MYKGTLPVGCGQCLPCTLNRRRLWSHRMVLEALKHGSSSFVTLTYDQKHLPEDLSLVKRDYQLFLKNLRKSVSPQKIRYYIVGEYGETSGRPHYHLALFGHAPCEQYPDDVYQRAFCKCRQCTLISNAWGRGKTDCGSLTHDSAQYIAGYVTKKLNHTEDKCTDKCTHPPLNGRIPEFAKMSLKPGIGALAVDDIYNALSSLVLVDAPNTLRHGGKELPLGRYLKGKLREKIGVSDETKKSVLLEYAEKMFKLFRENKDFKKSKKAFILEENKQKVRNLEARYKLYKKGKTL